MTHCGQYRQAAVRLIHRTAEATRIIASNGSKIFRFEIDGRFFAEVIEVSS
jgi:hypothetical protein